MNFDMRCSSGDEVVRCVVPAVQYRWSAAIIPEGRGRSATRIPPLAPSVSMGITPPTHTNGPMPARHLALLSALTTLAVATAGAQQNTYPPIDRYLMPRDAEVALARTAAPSSISD